MKSKKCKLCAGSKTEKIYEDSVCWIAKPNKDNGTKAIIVYNSHNKPSQREVQHMWAMTQKFFPNKLWSDKNNNSLGHWYEYIRD